MKWTDQAVVLSVRKYAENAAIARLITHAHGLHAGVVRGVHSKHNRGIFQSGNKLLANWQAKLPEQLGTFTAELITPCAALIMQDARALAALNSASMLIEVSLAEHEPHVDLFEAFSHLLESLTIDADWEENYVHFELVLLSTCGFRLDLSSCAATDTVEDLIYVSPKSGRAVCAVAGEQYKERMLRLPGFLIGQASRRNNRREEILDGIRLSGYFIEHWLLESHNKRVPAARTRLLGMIAGHG